MLWLRTAAVSLFLVVVLSTAGVSGTTKVVHFVYHTSQVMSTLQELKAEFEAQNPGVEIELQTAVGAGYVDKLQALIAAGQAPDITDLYLSLALPFLNAGMFEDLRPWFERDKEISLSMFLPIAVAGHTNEKGEIWGFPWNLWVLHPIYNESMFRESGLATPEEDPANWTWQKLRDYGKKLTRTRGDGTTDVWGLRIWPYMGRDIVFVIQAGGAFFDREINPTRGLWLSPAVRQGLQFMVDLYKDGTVTASGIGPQGSFTAGKVAINLAEGNFGVGPLVQANVKERFDWGISRWPMGPKNDGTQVGGSSWQILRSSKNKELAWKWLKFVLASREGALGISKGSGRASAIARYVPLWVSLFREHIPTATVMPDLFANPHNAGSEIFAERDKVQDKYNAEIKSVLNGEKPLESALVILDEYTKTILGE